MTTCWLQFQNRLKTRSPLNLLVTYKFDYFIKFIILQQKQKKPGTSSSCCSHTSVWWYPILTHQVSPYVVLLVRAWPVHPGWSYPVLTGPRRQDCSTPTPRDSLEEVAGRPRSGRGSVVILEDGDGRSGCRFSGLITEHNIRLWCQSKDKVK